MKYINPYNESLDRTKQLDVIIDNIKDILVDVEDDGFQVSIMPFYRQKFLLINIFQKRVFEFSEIKDSVSHLLSFMKEEGYDYNIQYYSDLFDCEMKLRSVDDFNLFDNNLKYLKLKFDL